ncbi:MAG: LytTR family DNA-binding domain-containing protein [Gammaproteobacteria bacterium]|nr:LytTR family DNA-binding domain-containing protein [Gammaproteobacteria bacterium]
MKVLIVDDEAPARDRLIHMVSSIDSMETSGQASNGLEAVRMVQDSHPDVVLMDIRMPGMDGLEAARHLSEMDEPPAIIFTTAYSEHALEAYDANAVDYLVKPIRQEKLEKSLAKARKLTKAQIAALNIETNNTGRSHICARIRGNLELIPVDEIVYFQADQKYITVRHLGGEVLIEDALKNLETEFEDRLIRIHRNALVSTNYITGMEKNIDGRFVVSFKEIDDKLEISRRHVAEVRKFLKFR